MQTWGDRRAPPRRMCKRAPGVTVPGWGVGAEQPMCRRGRAGFRRETRGRGAPPAAHRGESFCLPHLHTRSCPHLSPWAQQLQHPHPTSEAGTLALEDGDCPQRRGPATSAPQVVPPAVASPRAVAQGLDCHGPGSPCRDPGLPTVRKPPLAGEQKTPQCKQRRRRAGGWPGPGSLPLACQAARRSKLMAE